MMMIECLKLSIPGWKAGESDGVLMNLIATQHHIIYKKESVKLGRLGRRQMDSRDF